MNENGNLAGRRGGAELVGICSSLVVYLGLVVVCGRGTAAELKSGLEVGELADQFFVKDCTGPAAGKTLCYYCRYADRPVVALFVRDLNDEVVNLVQRVDKLVGQNSKQRLAAFVVLLGDDTQASEKRLKEIAKKRRLRHVPLTIYRDKASKLTEIYRIAPKASVTATFWEQGKVGLNRAYATPKLTSQQVDEFATSLKEVLSP